MQDLVGVDRRRLEGVGAGVGVRLVQAAELVVIVGAVLQVMHHGKGRAVHRQKDQKADAGGAVPLAQLGGVQAGAQVIDGGVKVVALVRAGAAGKAAVVGGMDKQPAVRRAVVTGDGSIHVVRGALRLDPVHGDGQRLAAFGDGSLVPGGAVLLVQIDADQHAGPAEQPGAAVHPLGLGQAGAAVPAAEPLVKPVLAAVLPGAGPVQRRAPRRRGRGQRRGGRAAAQQQRQRQDARGQRRRASGVFHRGSLSRKRRQTGVMRVPAGAAPACRPRRRPA